MHILYADYADQLPAPQSLSNMFPFIRLSPPALPAILSHPRDSTFPIPLTVSLGGKLSPGKARSMTYEQDAAVYFRPNYPTLLGYIGGDVDGTKDVRQLRVLGIVWV